MTIRAFIPHIAAVVVRPNGNLQMFFDTTYTGPEILEWSGGFSSAFTHPCDVEFVGDETLAALSRMMTDCVKLALSANTGLTMNSQDIILLSFSRGLL